MKVIVAALPHTPAPPFGARLRLRRTADLRTSDVRRDRSAFATLYVREHDGLYRYCRSIVGHDADARDALQTAMTKALAALDDEHRDFALRPWLYRIVHNEAITLLRRRRPSEPLDPDAVAADVDLPQAIDDRARLAHLRTDLAALPERQRAALVLRELNGLGHSEIAAVLGCSAQAVKQSIFEARTALGEYERGRALDCAAVRRVLSEGDGRRLRSRSVRAHVRGCRGCEAFEAALGRRPHDLALIAPAPAFGAAALLARHGLAAGGAVGTAGTAAAGTTAVGAAGTTATGAAGAAGAASAGASGAVAAGTLGTGASLGGGLGLTLAAKAAVALVLVSGAAAATRAVEHAGGRTTRDAAAVAGGDRADGDRPGATNRPSGTAPARHFAESAQDAAGGARSRPAVAGQRSQRAGAAAGGARSGGAGAHARRRGARGSDARGRGADARRRGAGRHGAARGDAPTRSTSARHDRAAVHATRPGTGARSGVARHGRGTHATGTAGPQHPSAGGGTHRSAANRAAARPTGRGTTTAAGPARPVTRPAAPTPSHQTTAAARPTPTPSRPAPAAAPAPRSSTPQAAPAPAAAPSPTSGHAATPTTAATGPASDAGKAAPAHP